MGFLGLYEGIKERQDLRLDDTDLNSKFSQWLFHFLSLLGLWLSRPQF